MSSPQKRRYFVAKCQNMQSLRKCHESGIWACNDRQNPPQPSDILTEAFISTQDVILLFSVNNCHGWHGYAKMLTKPGTDSGYSQMAFSDNTNQNENTGRDIDEDELMSASCHSDSNLEDKSSDATVKWHRFKINWLKLFLSEFGEQCLPFSSTSELMCADGTPLNKARNWQDTSVAQGEKVCELIDEHFQALLDRRKEKEEHRLQRRGPAFFTPGCEQSDMKLVWSRLVNRVQELGKIHLACAFGSQRYNLHTEHSDMDMLVIYEAQAHQVLSLNPPQQTIKNHETETCDYTVHELHRYCELLDSGDPRCVETLFLHPDTIFCCSEEWRQLCTHRRQFLTRKCFDKYLRDACGSKGVKQLEKWKKQDSGRMTDAVSSQVTKLSYVILRLLQNARQVALHKDLVVYRPIDSSERETLMKVRRGEYTFAQMEELINGLLGEIEILKTNFPEEEVKTDLRELIEKWLIEQRYKSLQSHNHVTQLT